MSRRFAGVGLTRRKGRTPPDLSETPWTPASLSGLIGWWRGDSVTYGATVTMTDLSGNGNDLTQGTAANQPTAGTALGQDSIDFDGVNDFARRITLTQGTLSQPTTIWSVQVFTATSGVRYLWDGVGGRNACYGVSPNLYAFAGGNLNGGAGITSNVVLAVYDNTSSDIYIDDLDTPAASGSVGATGLAGFTMCASNVATAPYGAKILEQGVLGEEISGADLDLLQSYINDRYGLSV